MTPDALAKRQAEIAAMASGSNGYFALDPAEPARRLAPGALAAQFGPGIIAAFEGRRRQAWAVHGADMLDAALTGGASQAGAGEMALPVLRRFTTENPDHRRTHASARTASEILAFITEIAAAHRTRGLAPLPAGMGPDWAKLPPVASRPPETHH